MLYRIICILIGYACGLFQTSYIYGKIKHIDIRDYGSGNAGTTNALRTLGKKAGAVTFIGDIMKPVIAMFICYLLFRNSTQDYIKALCLYAGAGAVLGHVFPVYLGFRGGKGIATLGGVAIWFSVSSGIWFALPISIAIFVLAVCVTKYVSLGSILMLLSYLIQLVIYGQTQICNIMTPYLYECYALFFILCAIAIYKHHGNIKRLLNGTENKIGQKSKK